MPYVALILAADVFNQVGSNHQGMSSVTCNGFLYTYRVFNGDIKLEFSEPRRE